VLVDDLPLFFEELLKLHSGHIRAIVHLHASSR